MSKVFKLPRIVGGTYPTNRPEIRQIIFNRYRFAHNEALVALRKPVVDVISRLEMRTAILADTFKELLQLVREILLRAAWGFCKNDATQLAKETISYGNSDLPFHMLHQRKLVPIGNRSPATLLFSTALLSWSL
ncbi:hypothetical protein PsorP6_017226 [Peronosclerospora sorghi]|uniref:Uncharacterized protein n=1 Tax=Peronosclerospora sorghi TaxID=230839 RepID=A0ACC0WGC3_9STRA|nr:hypothetical protein PsorP6_017226 [Peronosclerospora sorghi]